MTEHRQDNEARIDAYLDGSLTAIEMEQFERAMNGSETLAALVHCSRDISASLRRMFEPPAVPDWVRSSAGLAGSAERRAEPAVRQVPAVRQRDAGASGSRRRLALAACIAIVVSGAVLGWFKLRPTTSGAYDSAQWRTLAQVYADLDGPQFVPDSQAQFASMFAGRFGQAILFDDAAPDASVQGIAFCHSISRDTVCLFGSAGGRKALVFVDRLERDTRPQVPPDSGLYVFRRELGDLVLYEVSQNDRAKLLNWVYKQEGS
jgi:anti-sigma factor RsiW